MVSQPVIIDISSDEEESWADNWTDTGRHVDACEDAVYSDEFSSSNACGYQHSGLKDLKELNAESDDDCVILEGIANAKMQLNRDVGGDDDDDDDIVIVKGKGELASRDYPHPRHLCVKFPFNKTAHVKYCHKCHCYVCNSPAPCTYWRSGRWSGNHCDATDKEVKWISERKFCIASKKKPQGQEKGDNTQSSDLLMSSWPFHSPLRRQNFYFAEIPVTFIPQSNPQPRGKRPKFQPRTDISGAGRSNTKYSPVKSTASRKRSKFQPRTDISGAGRSNTKHLGDNL